MLLYVVLGMFWNCDLTGYALRKKIQEGIGVFYKASYGSIYPVLKKLTQQNWISLLDQESAGRETKSYRITESGRAAFLNWLSEPLSMEEGNGNSLVKVYFFDLLPPEQRICRLKEFEENNGLELQKLRLLEQKFNTKRNKEFHYYKLSTLYYGIQILEETIKWCQITREQGCFCREKGE